jgi:hypothetical protein
MIRCQGGKIAAGSTLNAQQFIEREYERLDLSYNDTNRTMYQFFSDSKFIVHDNNFNTYCKPHLQNLPPQCAFEMQSVRTQLVENECPPYRPVQHDVFPEPTVPCFRDSSPKRQEPFTLQPRAK